MKHLICNHKNKLTYNEVKDCVYNLNNIDTSKINMVVCPSLPYIYNFIKYNIGAQDVSAYEDVLTGEFSAKQLASLRVKYVIIGHPERRQLLNENQNLLIEKIKQANKYGIKVIYCISENEVDLESAKKEVEKDLEIIKKYLNKDAIVAYEPMWAIGSDLELDYDYIKKIIEHISTIIDNDIIYGGNVNDKNIDEFLKIDKINGFLISNSSLDYTRLQNIIAKIS